jgi:hypothetical protein
MSAAIIINVLADFFIAFSARRPRWQANVGIERLPARDT